MDQDNLRRFIDCANHGGLKPTIPVAVEALADPAQLNAWHDEKGMLAFRLKAAEIPLHR